MIHFAKWKAIAVLVIVLAGIIFASPNLVSRDDADMLPAWLPHRQINLGLDLRGGSHLLFQVDTEAVARERLDSVVDAVRDALRNEKIRYQDLGIDDKTVTVTILDREQEKEAVRLLGQVDRDLSLADEGGGRLRLTLSAQALRERQQSAIEQSLEIIRRRIDETGTREPTIQRQGADRILVQLPGIDDPERVKALIGKTAKMTFHIVDDGANAAEALAGRPPPGTVVLPLVEQRSGRAQPENIVVRRRIIVSGENLIDAQPTFQQGDPVVSFRFDSIGAKRFGDATSQNTGKALAIVLDGQVISAPRIREPILGGSGIISGSFTPQEAHDLALLLRAGALPAPLEVLEERTVGPGLGSDSIAAGERAGIVGAILVVVFTLVAYGTFGAIACLALIVNGILLIAAMSLLQATLTLPGIAGIVLTVGMAVDGNVLIFEHIREELRSGRTPVSAIDSGFTRALTTIVDSNLTTLFAAILLFIFGSGPVRGFAVTLGIGIVTSMFTAITFTRLIVLMWFKRTRPREMAI
ncbi:MAG: protein translocase subunit SecD [Rhodospirillales bacterium]|nr:protein translocase subunit SecD [Rhodospirillales bacterium]